MNPQQNQPGAGTPAPTPARDDAHAPAPVDLSEESVAGEEDPGASLDGDVDAPAAPPPRDRGG